MATFPSLAGLNPRIVDKIFELSYPDIAISKRYDLRTNDLQYENIFFHEIPKPSYAAMEIAITPFVSQAVLFLQQLEARILKELRFQDRYPIQTQIINVIQAILTANNTELIAMRNFWNSL